MPAFPMQNSDSQPSCVGVPGPPPAARMTSLTNRWPLRGSRPEITPDAGGMAAPPSAIPAAGSISANARCTAPVAPGAQRRNHLDHLPVADVEPLPAVRDQRAPAEFCAHPLDFALADTGRADGGKIIAAPLLRDANAHHAHVDDILNVLEARLN